MRGRARLVFSAVSVGGLCAAFVAPSVRLAQALPGQSAPGSTRSHHRTHRRSGSAFGGTVIRDAGRASLPRLTLIDFEVPTDTPGTLPPAAPPPPPPPPAPPAPPAPAPAAAVVAAPVARAPVHTSPTPPAVNGGSVGGAFACIRAKESNGNYSTNTGNGYYGAYQFSLSTWRSVGGTGLPSDASPATQDALAMKLQQRSGWGQWSTARMCGV